LLFAFWFDGRDGIVSESAPPDSSSALTTPPAKNSTKTKTKNFNNSYASNTRVKLILIASDPQPREDELRAVRGFILPSGKKREPKRLCLDLSAERGPLSLTDLRLVLFFKNSKTKNRSSSASTLRSSRPHATRFTPRTR
jgi:hypothetical protein